MQRTCAKCGHVNDNASPEASAACPECGAIYAKSAVAAVRERQTESVRARVDTGEQRAARERSAPSIIERILWLATLICAGIGFSQLILTTSQATSAPQQAAGAGMAIAWAAIPYCMARAVQLFNR